MTDTTFLSPIAYASKVLTAQDVREAQTAAALLALASLRFADRVPGGYAIYVCSLRAASESLARLQRTLPKRGARALTNQWVDGHIEFRFSAPTREGRGEARS
jgi:hypothetical protein